MVDEYETPFGIRTIAADPDRGFLLNGRRVPVKGVCNHHDLGALGAAVHVRALERQVELLKEMGANAIRTSHNPPAPELLEVADRLGMLVMDEAFDAWRRGKRRPAGMKRGRRRASVTSTTPACSTTGTRRTCGPWSAATATTRRW